MADENYQRQEEPLGTSADNCSSPRLSRRPFPHVLHLRPGGCGLGDIEGAGTGVYSMQSGGGSAVADHEIKLDFVGDAVTVWNALQSYANAVTYTSARNGWYFDEKGTPHELKFASEGTIKPGEKVPPGMLFYLRADAAEQLVAFSGRRWQSCIRSNKTGRQPMLSWIPNAYALHRGRLPYRAALSPDDDRSRSFRRRDLL